jgi:hypothetical protein
MQVEKVRVESQRDRELGSRIQMFLEARCPHLPPLEVAVSGDSIFLQGQMRSDSERRLALACCTRVAGVLKLVDRLTVVQDNGGAEDEASNSAPAPHPARQDGANLAGIRRQRPK